MPVKKKASKKKYIAHADVKIRRIAKVTHHHPKVEHFLKILTGLYPCDPWSPGIVISYLRAGVWYGAVYQYPVQDRKYRVRLHMAKELQLDMMLEELFKPWAGITIRKTK